VANSTLDVPLRQEDFVELMKGVDSRFQAYMHARQILSTLPDRTIRRYRRKAPKQPRMTREENDLLHGMVAALFAYQQDAVACAQSGADFASGLMASATCEVLAIFGLLLRKQEVRNSKRFKILWRTALERKKKSGSRITFGKFLLELRMDDLFRMAREVGLYDEFDLSDEVSEALEARGYRGRLSEFVRRARNCIHPRWNLEANDKYAKLLDVFYSPSQMKGFHVDFALCAWDLHDRLNRGLRREAQGADTDGS